MKDFLVQCQPYQHSIEITAARFEIVGGAGEHTLVFYGEQSDEIVAQFRVSELIGWWEKLPLDIAPPMSV